MKTRTLVLISALAVVILAAASTVAFGLAHDNHDHAIPWASPFPGSCTAPNLTGTVVDVRLMNAGGPMMNAGGAMMGGAMRLVATPSTVPAGQVTFLATNMGSVTHELVVLPLPANQIVGTRATGSDGTIDESQSLGEASNSCGAGSGEGITPGASSWVTLALRPGRYELICNLPGHYAAGMYTQLTVR